MPKLFGVDLAKEIKKGFNNGRDFPLIKLFRVTPGVRSPTNPTAGNTSTERPYSCRGFAEEYKDGEVDGTIIRAGMRKVLILGATLPNGIAPMPGDELEVERQRWKIDTKPGSVQRDPAGATYTCRVS